MIDEVIRILYLSVKRIKIEILQKAEKADILDIDAADV